MFLIPTYLAPSSIHGVGVFTPFPLSAGSRLWQFDLAVDWRITPEEMERFPEPYRAQFLAFSYVDEQGQYVLCGDNARYMNHSDEPNCDDTGGLQNDSLERHRCARGADVRLPQL